MPPVRTWNDINQFLDLIDWSELVDLVDGEDKFQTLGRSQKISKDINPYPWILKKSKTQDCHRACFQIKKSVTKRCIICIYFCALDFDYDVTSYILGFFFQNARSVMVSKIHG